MHTRGIFRDVTARKAAEKDLRESEEKYRSLFNQSLEGIYLHDLEGRILDVNDMACAQSGYSREEWLGLTVFDGLPSKSTINPSKAEILQIWSQWKPGQRYSFEVEHQRKDGSLYQVEISTGIVRHGDENAVLAVVKYITERKRAEETLKNIEWMLSHKLPPDNDDQAEDHDQGYGDLTELNSDGLILKSIGSELLRSFSNDYLQLLGTSSAIYELNGDYAFGIFTSGWCRMMDRASRELCNTPDNTEALNSGRWLCHESCWTSCSKEAILKREQVDIECNGGIRLYAVPIIASGEVVGAINFGYGDPPVDIEKLQKLADAYQVDYDDLVCEARAYETRPPYIIELAKNRLYTTARLIGSMIETKQAEEAISKSEEKHRRLFETMAQGVIYQAADSKIVSANPAAEDILGLSFEQMQGKTSMDPHWQMIEEDGTAIPGTDHPAMIALRTGQTVGPVTRGVYHPDKNSHIWLSITAIPLFQPGETEPFQAYATFTDITELKQAGEELLKFKTAVEQSVDGVAMSDMDGNILFINRAWIEMHGYSLDEVKGRHLSIFHSKEQLDQYVTPFNERLIVNGSIRGEVEHTRKDGTTFTAYMTTTIIRGSDNKPFGMLAIARDITERKKFEEALKRQARERAAVDTFTYSVSNDLKAPLRRIEGFSEMLLEECHGQLNEQARDYLTRIITQIGSMKKITDALLQLSSVVSHEIDREAVDLSALVCLNLEKLQYKDPERLLETVVTPGLIAEGDADLLNILLGNLLDNAWKFTSEMEKVRIEFGSVEQDGRKIYYLKDNGVGFDMNHADKLFTPFHKLHRAEDYPGIGIGLNLAYRIIARHGGEIWAEGEIGQGACFYFTLP